MTDLRKQLEDLVRGPVFDDVGNRDVAKSARYMTSDQINCRLWAILNEYSDPSLNDLIKMTFDKADEENLKLKIEVKSG
jgi:hypothetical protein